MVSVPTRQGRASYQIFYGDFATREAAAAMARRMPAAFGHPALVRYDRVLKLLPGTDATRP